MNFQKELKRITSAYFDSNVDFTKLSTATKEYKLLLNEICDQNLDTEEGRLYIESENGAAIGTFWAALCLDDILRTRQFILGTDLAIQEKIIPEKKVHVLYAGTGPFATLILPIILKYPPQKIKYTLMEINPLSFELLKKVLSELQLDEYDITLVNADATKYKIDPDNKPDIILSETMQNALAREQQVPIFLNLMRQVQNDAIFIPEKIEINVGMQKWMDPNESEDAPRYIKESKVFEVSKEAIFSENPTEKLEADLLSFQKKEVTIERENCKDFNSFVILTEIQVFHDVSIKIGESGLTAPIIIDPISEDETNNILVETQYVISSEPKLEYTLKRLQSVS